VKYVLVIYEGAADMASDELEGSTPLQLARNVHATALMNRGMAGFLDWTQGEPVSRIEHALAMVLGIAPEEAQKLRRGPVEASGTPVPADSWTYAYRGNYVTTDGGEIRESRVSSLSLDETTWLTDALQEATKDLPVKLAVLGTGRIAVMFDQLKGKVDPGEFPHSGTPVDPDEDDSSAQSDRVVFGRKSAECLADQTLNEVRLDLGENPASQVWLWAGGPPCEIGRPFIGAPLKAVMITNSPLGRGMAALCRMKCHSLGDVWSDQSKPELIETSELAEAIAGHELTVIYVEAPEENGGYGSPVEKVKALDRLDIHVLGRVVEAVERVPETRLMLVALPEENVLMNETPILVCGAGAARDRVERWDETMCMEGSIGRLAAHRGLTRLLGD